MTSRKQQMRLERERQTIKQMESTIDVHDVLHSIFWGKPKREEMRRVWAKLDGELNARSVNAMKAEIEELVVEGLARIPKREGW